MDTTMFKGAKGNISSKRIIGAVLLFYVMIIISVAVWQELDIKPNTAGLLTTLVLTGGGMIAAGVAEKVIKK